jgi:hypothetical protein
MLPGDGQIIRCHACTSPSFVSAPIPELTRRRREVRPLDLGGSFDYLDREKVTGKLLEFANCLRSGRSRMSRSRVLRRSRATGQGRVLTESVEHRFD